MSGAENEALCLSIPLPRSFGTRIFLRLSTRARAVMLSLTTATQDETGVTRPMGSFVYAMPNPLDDKNPLSTTLFSSVTTDDFTTRLAKLLARRVQLPLFVTNSMDLTVTGMGGTVEEEMEAFKHVVEVTTDALQLTGIGALALDSGSSTTTT